MDQTGIRYSSRKGFQIRSPLAERASLVQSPRKVLPPLKFYSVVLATLANDCDLGSGDTADRYDDEELFGFKARGASLMNRGSMENLSVEVNGKRCTDYELSHRPKLAELDDGELGYRTNLADLGPPPILESGKEENKLEGGGGEWMETSELVQNEQTSNEKVYVQTDTCVGNGSKGSVPAEAE